MVDKNDIFYRSGDVFLPKGVRSFLEHYHIGDSRSVFYVSNWTGVHFLSGILTGWFLLNYQPQYDYYITGFILHTIWEFWQIFIGMTKIGTPRGQMDLVVDTVAFLIGMVVYIKLVWDPAMYTTLGYPKETNVSVAALARCPVLQ